MLIVSGKVRPLISSSSERLKSATMRRRSRVSINWPMSKAPGHFHLVHTRNCELSAASVSSTLA